MGILAWIIVGLIGGFIGSKIVNKSGEGMLLDIALGVVGALVGGFVMHLFGTEGVNGINIWSIFVSALGSVVFLVIYHAIRGAGHRAAP